METNMRFCLALLALLIAAGNAIAADRAVLPRDAVLAGLKQADCDEPFEEGAEKKLEPMALGNSLQLVEVRCWRGPYNYSGIFFAVDAKAPEKARLLKFQDWDGKQFVTAIPLMGTEYDPKTQTLSSFYKGRGVGDCGSVGEWQWRGPDFRMVRFFAKEKCDGKLFEPGPRWQVFPRR
jgi:hypothetical protein